LQVSLVINFDLPEQPENYLRRVQSLSCVRPFAHSSKFRRKGVAINFVTTDDWDLLEEIQRFCNIQINELPSNTADLI
jgi:superfamily II DNA/RNA helicase